MPKAAIPAPHAEFNALTKPELRELANLLLHPNAEPWVVERCVAFVVAETSGLWHGRARAMMCRRLKHCHLGRTHQSQLVAVICGRLEQGAFSEQFKDQLRLALHLAPTTTAEACRKLVSNPLSHVRRYAEWVLSPEHTQNAH